MSLWSDLRACRAPVVVFGTMGAMWGAFAALVPQIKAGVGAGDAVFGAALFAGATMLLVAMWLAPRIEARLGLAALPVMGALMCLAFLLPGAVGTIPLLAVAVGAGALTSGTTDVIMNARIAALEEETGRPLMNLNHAMFSLIYMCAALLAGAGREAGWSAFQILSCVVLVGLVAIPFSITRRTPRTAPEDSLADLPTLSAGPIVLWGGLIVFAGFLGEHAAESWSALHLERTLGGRAAEGAAGPALLGGMMFIGRMTGQIMAAKLRARDLLLAGGALAALGALTAAAAATLAQAYLGFAMLGLGVSVLAPTALGMVAKRVSQSRRTRTIAQVSMVGFLGFFVGPPLIGGLSALFGLRWALASLAIFMLLVPLALHRLSRHHAPSSPS